MNKIFDKVAKIFIILLPFSVVISVFFQFKIHFWVVSMYKEILLIILFVMLIYDKFKTKKKFIFDLLDYLIFWYFWYLLLISLINLTNIKSFLYWSRYDFEFLLIFLIFRHWAYLLKEKLSYYLRLFLYSWWAAILIWALIRFVIWENVLTHIGFSPILSTWNSGQSVPIYHWIEWANIRRFQWIFDWPNQAAFFILVYLWILFHYLKNKKDYYFYLFLTTFFLLWLIFLTYSRSSLIWVILGAAFVCVANIKIIFKKYKNIVVLFLVFMSIIWGIFYFKYSTNFSNIVLRAGSSKWHSERMIIWFNQFLAKPFWAWLASSWPAYRLAHDTKWIDEKYFIPESWYVQQLVEGWFIGFILFISVIILIFYRLYSTSLFLSGTFVAVLIMNSLLHTFEAVYVSLILFMFLWIFLKSWGAKNNQIILWK